MPITKAVITAAGYGTRFLPATKNVPKEMLPILNKPTIHYIVEQCIEAGIKDIIIVTRYGNTAVEDYFDITPGLQKYLQEKGKAEAFEEIEKIYNAANFVFVRQKANLPYGNASPLYSVKDLLGDDPFVFSWGDEFVVGKPNGVSEAVISYGNQPCDAILTCSEVTRDVVHKYGIVKIKEGTTDVITDIVEKPTAEAAPSLIASQSPYIFTSKLFNYLHPEVGTLQQEMSLSPAISDLIKDGGLVRANITKGQWMDTGSPLNFLKTTVELALQRDDLRDEFKEYLRTKL